MSGQPVLEATELVAGYIPEVNILNGCNLVVEQGEFVGIIGPNGAGKSTLLKAILGQCTIRSGTVTLRDSDIWVMRRDGTAAAPVTTAQSTDGYPVWAPRGDLIGFLEGPAAKESGRSSKRPRGS